MKTAYDNGVNFFDNAEVYATGRSEKVMGKLLKKFKWPRDTYTVSSKVFWGGDLPNQKGLSRKHVLEACDAALNRLQVDYLDLYFCHRPDISTPVEETVWAMHSLIMQGKVLYWGTSEWSAQEIQEAIGVAKQHHLIGPTMEQPQYNMFWRERFEVEYYKLFRDYGLGSTIWSPLASGVLTGKYNEKFPKGTRLSIKNLEWIKERSMSRDKIKKTIRLSKLADELGCTMAQLALAWTLKNPNVSTTILGASKVSQLKENLKAIDVVQSLTLEVMNEIEGILKNKVEVPSF